MRTLIGEIIFISVVLAFFACGVVFTLSTKDSHKNSCILTAERLGYEAEYKENKDICLYYDSQKNIKAIKQILSNVLVQCFS